MKTKIVLLVSLVSVLSLGAGSAYAQELFKQKKGEPDPQLYCQFNPNATPCVKH